VFADPLASILLDLDFCGPSRSQLCPRDHAPKVERFRIKGLSRNVQSGFVLSFDMAILVIPALRHRLC
jgi:hypothetical protein